MSPRPGRLSRVDCRALLPVLLIALAGCGGEAAPDRTAESAVSGDEEEISGQNPYVDAADLCSLVPLQEVAAAAGGTDPMRTETGESTPASCRYFFDVPDPYGARQASATLQMLYDYDLERMGTGQSAIDIAGVGDDAWASSHTDTYVLYARRDSLVFSVNVAGGRDGDWPGMARAIAEVVLAHL